MDLCDRGENDTSFGSFYGHPEGNSKSKEFIIRMLDEFELDFAYFDELILSIEFDPEERVTSLQGKLRDNLRADDWIYKPKYPESEFEADFGLEQDGRWILVEIELSDIRRSVSASYMSRAFRTGYMRLGIFIAPESNNPERGKNFYSSLKRRYDYLAPDYPLWVIGFTYP